MKNAQHINQQENINENNNIVYYNITNFQSAKNGGKNAFKAGGTEYKQ